MMILLSKLCFLIFIKVSLEDDVHYRLPLSVVPQRYNVSLEPHLYSNPPTFTGNTSIEIMTITNETTEIVFHAHESLILNRNNLRVIDLNGTEIPQNEPIRDKVNDFYTINLKKSLNQGIMYTIVASNYTGLLQTDNAGFYLATYKDGENNVHRFGTTQFQSVGARRVYPCFDEPAYKAIYSVRIVHSPKYSAISNQESTQSKCGNDCVSNTFLETPVISSYAMAYVVSDFTFIKNGKFKIYARPQAVAENLANYSLQVGERILNIFENYLNYNYSLPKLDQIAIPDEYFAPGAMENWGLITYRESYLLYSPEMGTTNELQKTAQSITHEIAHQWFGDLVTLQWWNFLWLNEGFATYFEYFATSSMEPSWRLMDQFVLSAVQYALSKDCTDETQPINFATTPPGGGPPTWVAYQKGAAILRMIERFLSPELFKSALNHYLLQNEFRNVRSTDFYASLQAVVDMANANHLISYMTTREIVSSWELNKGYPLVKATVTSNGSLRLRQSRYLLDNSNGDVWHIPLNFACGGEFPDFANASVDVWLVNGEKIVPHPCKHSSNWLIINKQQTGYYRVNYDRENWEKIISFLQSDNFTEIDVLNRAQIIDDAFNLAKSGHLPYDIPLNLSRFLSRENDYLPWYSYLNAVSFLNCMLIANSTSYRKFREYVLDLTENLLENLSFDEKTGDTHVDKLNRNILLKNLCYLDHKLCIENSFDKLISWMKDDTYKIQPDLQEVVFCGSMRIANQTVWNFLYGKYLNTSHYSYSYKLRMITALGCSKDETILIRFIDMIVNISSEIEPDHKFQAFKAIFTSSDVGLDVAFQFIENDISLFMKIFPNYQSILNDISARFKSEDYLRRLEYLSKKSKLENVFVKPLENIKSSIDWVKIYKQSIDDWLAYWR